ncbi:hypothetical protein [Lachnoclostridium sp. Marseille-P6806]|uniref:hypothetical protein n=1 Tax=Lachnoclostridium sp. Marseille-P6806 TaxID=2364793 RepID=UPI00103154C1|nr:hypothetical protein [Lachnoclostridium sp. Marseille-P6806]
MSEKLKKLLREEGGNYLLPFFWQHGEPEWTLRKYMHVIHDAGIGAVCIESRPHPDFAGPGWWHDLDTILDEARQLDMKVWILDDSHFPTGFANGAVDRYSDDYCRQSITRRAYPLHAGEELHLTEEELRAVPKPELTQMQQYLKEKNPRTFADDRVLDVYFAAGDGSVTPVGAEKRDTKRHDAIPADGLSFTAPADGKLIVLYLSRNLGYHTHYVNMTQAKSVRILIDEVYEAHWKHYAPLFGNTIAGFFSDEPELGNGFMYERVNYAGNPACDFPWGEEMGALLQQSLGRDYTKKLWRLWENPGSHAGEPDCNEAENPRGESFECRDSSAKEDCDGTMSETARVRVAYMDALTGLVKKNFSLQIGDWCRAHGVQYIGHLIEDNDQHEMTGASLGHYFRGLAGQDWAGVDDIGGQVYPQGEDDTYDRGVFQTRDGEFYHFCLGRLASSAAAIEPGKQGNSMCEIFGAYGWGEGVKLEKYLVDHFMVRGVNHFVPHAFSPKAFPDPDCPPHFYAHGHNPQYRAFGSLMRYTNRVLELLNGGRHISPVAVLYSAEAVWADHDTAMECHAVSRPLTENQIGFDFIPSDVFTSPDEYQLTIGGDGFRVNTQQYQALIVPETKYIRRAAARAIPALQRAGVQVIFIGRYPEILLEDVCKEAGSAKADCTESGRTCGARDNPSAARGESGASVQSAAENAHGNVNENGEGNAAGTADGAGDLADTEILQELREVSSVCTLEELIPILRKEVQPEVTIEPADKYIRTYLYEEVDGSAVLIFVNEGREVYRGTADLRSCRKGRSICWYDAWSNEVHAAEPAGDPAEELLSLTIEPEKSRILILDRGESAGIRDIAGIAAGSGSDAAYSAKCWWQSDDPKRAEKPEQQPECTLTPDFAEKTAGSCEADFDGAWMRSLTGSLEYPAFGEAKEVLLPDHLEKEEKTWSGIARYENSFTAEPGKEYFLTISDAAEAVEVFVNGVSLGIQIVPEYEYDLTPVVREGMNQVRIEVATTLEREMSTVPNPYAVMLGKSAEPTNPSGLNGTVRLLEKER